MAHRHGRLRAGLAGLCLALMLSACGGGDDAPAAQPQPQPQPLPAGTIGAAGGTVTGPSGSQVVIPAGALGQNVAFSITASNTGAPALPANMTVIGPMLAFTPHGTAFAQAATVTVPFDASLVPAGATPVLLKTNAARDGWETVAGATVTGNLLVGSVNAFSYFVPSILPFEGSDFNDEPPFRIWSFHHHLANDEDVQLDEDETRAGVVDDDIEFGLTSISPTGNDTVARGSVYSNATGFTYWVDAEAPIGNVNVPTDPVGADTRLFQRKFFRKATANARLNFLVTQAWIEAIDNNGSAPVLGACPWNTTQAPALCFDELSGEVTLTFLVVNYGADTDGGRVHAAYQGIARAWGYQGDWRWDVTADPIVRIRFPRYHDETEHLIDVTPIFNEDQFDFEVNDGASNATDFSMRLANPVPVEIDLSGLAVGDVFMVDTYAIADAHNRRGRESYVASRLRDPGEATGLEWEFTGLTPLADLSEDVEINDGPELTCSTPVTANAGTVQFSAPDYSLPEFGRSSARVKVTRTGGSEGRVVARVMSTDGTALAGQHFQRVVQTVVFQNGDTVPRTIAVPTVNDNVFGGSRNFTLTLEPVGECANIGDPAEVPVTILDDETPLPQSFTIGGQVTGLVGSGLILQEVGSGREDSVQNGAFTFQTQFANGAAYEVRVRTQPSNPIQSCTVTNGSGTVSDANVINVAVTCSTPVSSGALDPLFGAGGKVTTGMPGGADRMAVQGDGKIVLLSDHLLARYLADGTQDTTFGMGGSVAVNFTGISQVARALVVQDDGRILVAGNGRPSTADDFAVARFNVDGSLDSSFGTGGITYVDFGGTDRATGILVQSTGRIVVTGYTVPVSGQSDFAVARLTEAGVLDASFGTAGRTVSTLQALDFAYAAALTNLDEIVIAGTTATDGGASADTAIVRLLADGAPDNSFGGAGLARVAFSTGNEEVRHILVQPDRKIVIAGFLSEGNANMLVARLNTDASRDTGFGTDGLLSIDYSNGGTDSANAIALQNDGSIVVAGSATSATGTDFALVRLTTAGTLDDTFGAAGQLNIDFFGAADNALAVRIQPDGRIVVAGSTWNASSWVLGLARVIP